MRRRDFLRNIGALACVSPFAWVVGSSVQSDVSDFPSDFPIVYKKPISHPANALAIARVFCRMEKDGFAYTRINRECIDYLRFKNLVKVTYQSVTDFDEKVSWLFDSAFLNQYACCDWSYFLDGVWRMWQQTYSIPVVSVCDPYWVFEMFKIVFLNPQDFILYVYVTDKARNIRITGHSGYKGSHNADEIIPERFCDREYIPATEWLTSDYFKMDVTNSVPSIKVLFVEQFNVNLGADGDGSIVAPYGGWAGDCSWNDPYSWASVHEKKNVFENIDNGGEKCQ